MTQKILGDIFLDEDQDQLKFGNENLLFSVSKRTGNLLEIRDQQEDQPFLKNQADQPTLCLRIDGSLKYPGVVRNSRVFELVGETVIGLDRNFERIETLCLDRLARCSVVSREGDWTITDHYLLAPGSLTVERRIQLTYTGTSTPLLRDMRWMLPGLCPGAHTDYLIEAPDFPVTGHFPMTNLPEGIWQGLDSRTLTAPGKVQHSVDAPGSVVGLLGFMNPKAESAWLVWPHSTNEFNIMELQKEGDEVDLYQWVFLADRFHKGHSLEAGSQYLRRHHGTWQTAMQDFQCWYGGVDIEVPDDKPCWAVGTAIYEVHVGSAPFLGGNEYEPYPTMHDLAEDLPRIAGLGFEILQIMPHWPFCGYTVHNYHDIAKQYGDPDGMREVVNLAQKLGMRVILDVVLHGCVDQEIIREDRAAFGPHYDFIFEKWLQLSDPVSVYRREHPDWFMQNEAGETASIYTWAFDLANKDFQNFFVDVLIHYLNDFHVDGFRFDAPTWNCMPNWKADLPYHASAAYYAAFELMHRVRQNVRTFKPDILLYTEPSGPLFRDSMNLTYNYDEEWLTGSLMDVISPRGYPGAQIYTEETITARQAAEWLHYRDLSLPAGSETVHHLDSHDTFWWGEMAQFRHEAFGHPAARAMFAFYALIGGGIMVYNGGENGSEPFYRQLLKLRQTHPVLRYGQTDYLGIQVDAPTVFAVRREFQGSQLVVLINLSAALVTCQVSLPVQKMGITSGEHLVHDILNQQELAQKGRIRLNKEDLADLKVELTPFKVMILQVLPVEEGEA